METFELSEALQNAVILIDTREQDTSDLRRRIKMFGVPCERQKLDFGDYSIKTTIQGREISLANKVAVERKMSLDELAGNFTRGRDRFCREFNKAKKANGKIYIVCENGSYEKITLHDYRSKYEPKAFISSLCVWQARYPCSIHFCSDKIAPRLIYHLLFYALREELKDAETDGGLDKTVSADD